MCFQNCPYEGYNGECTLNSYPKGWICPPDQEQCFQCGGIFDWSTMEDGLCQECQEEKVES